MTDKVQKIREEVVRMHNLLPVMDGDNISVNYADRICTTLEMYIDSLQEEPVSEGLEEAADEYAPDFSNSIASKAAVDAIRDAFKAGAKWQKKHLWKPADGDDLPEIDKEVIVLCKNGRVAFGHRPVEKFMARPIGYGRSEEYEVKTYDKGGWNIPNVKYWLDVELPKEIEL